MTLIEILIVMILMGLITAGLIAGTNQLAGARLRKSATTLVGGIRVAFTRATATSKSIRMVFDLDHQTIWLEEGSRPMLVQARDKTGTGGADPVTEAERAAVAEGNRITQGPMPPRAAFKPIKDLGFEDAEKGVGVKSLGRGINFRSVQTGHDDAPMATGRAYLYFWPGGQTERAAIQLRIGDSTEDKEGLTLLVAPLTGRVTIASGARDLPMPKGDKEASDRDDPENF